MSEASEHYLKVEVMNHPKVDKPRECRSETLHSTIVVPTGSGALLCGPESRGRKVTIITSRDCFISQTPITQAVVTDSNQVPPCASWIPARTVVSYKTQKALYAYSPSAGAIAYGDPSSVLSADSTVISITQQLR